MDVATGLVFAEIAGQARESLPREDAESASPVLSTPTGCDRDQSLHALRQNLAQGVGPQRGDRFTGLWSARSDTLWQAPDQACRHQGASPSRPPQRSRAAGKRWHFRAQS